MVTVPRIAASRTRARQNLAIRSAAETLGTRLLAPGSDPETVYRDVRLRLVAQTIAAGREDSARPEPALLTLSELYETLLRFQPEIGPGGRFVLRSTRARRRQSGSFYTPWWLATRVAEMALEPFLDWSAPPRVLDPAMGTGLLLLAAARVMSARWSSIPLPYLARSHLFGVELDSEARAIALAGLELETGARQDVLATRLITGDLLAGTTSPISGPDVVIGNPPWDGRDAVDPFKRFLTLAADMTRGGVTMVVPRAVLLQQTHADARERLLAHLAPYSALLLHNSAFSGPAAPACVLAFGPKPGPAGIRVVEHSGQGLETIHEVPASRWNGAGFVTEREDLWMLSERMRASHLSLRDLAHLYRVRDAGLNYSHASVARRSLYHAPVPEDPRDFPVYRGRDFNRYTPVCPGSRLRHDATVRLQGRERLHLNRQVAYLPEKIVIRQTADCLVATLDRSQAIPGRSTMTITAEDSISLPALLACLNSRLLTALYRVRSGETGRILPQVKVGRLLDLPVPAIAAQPFPPPTGFENAAIWTRLHTLALRQIENGSVDPLIDAEIDSLVEGLYTLTVPERRLLAPP